MLLYDFNDLESTELSCTYLPLRDFVNRASSI
jgi:hypothetical protein